MSFKELSGRLWASGIIALVFMATVIAGCTQNDTTRNQTSTPETPTPGDPSEEQGITLFASVTVASADVARLGRVSIVPNHAILPAGETALFSAIAYDTQGKPIPPQDVDATWRMIDAQAGTISPSGVFRAGTQRGAFNNAIEVTVSHEVNGEMEELQSIASVSVIRPLSELDISRVQVLPSELQLPPGTQVNLNALALDRDGAPVPDVDYSWEMLDLGAGTISTDGRFTSGTSIGMFPGAIRVIAKKREDPTKSASAVVSVNVTESNALQAPSKVTLYPQAVVLRPGDTMGFRALVLDPKGNIITNVEASWSLRDNSGGELDNNGNFRAGSTPGTYTNLIEVTMTSLAGDSSTTLTATASVTILAPPENQQNLERLILTPQSSRLRPGETVQLAATALSHSGKILPSATLRWAANSDAITVTSGGLVTAKNQPGIYKDAVTVTVTDGEGSPQISQTASATVIILGPLASVEIVPSNADVLPRQVIQFIFLAYDVNGVRLFDITASWEILNKDAGTIDSTGLFVAGQVPGEYKNAIKVTVKTQKHMSGF